MTRTLRLLTTLALAGCVAPSDGSAPAVGHTTRAATVSAGKTLSFATSGSANRAFDSVAVASGTTILLAWRQQDPLGAGAQATNALVAERIAADGTPLDASPRVFAGPGTGVLNYGVAVAKDVFLVAWQLGLQADVVGQRMAPDGTLLDASPVVLFPQCSGNMVVAGTVDNISGAATFLVGGCTLASNAQGVMRYASDGTAIDTTPLALPAPSGTTLRAPVSSVAGAYGEFLALGAWSSGSTQETIVTSTLIPARSAPTTTQLLYDATGEFNFAETPLGAATGDGGFFVVWTGTAPGTDTLAEYQVAERDVWGRPLDLDGAPTTQAATRVYGGPGTQMPTSLVPWQPSGAFGQTGLFLAFWDDASCSGSAQCGSGSLGTFAARGAFLRTDGTPEDPAGIDVAPAMTVDPPAAIAGPSNDMLVFVSLGDANGTTTPWNLTLYDVTHGLAAATGSCATGSDCASGSCRAGVCCDTACDQPCQTCAVAEGASTDGTCTLRPAASVCRPAANACDVAETCNGRDVTCPPDPMLDGGTCALDGGHASDAAIADAGVPRDASSADATVVPDLVIHAPTLDGAAGGNGGGGGCAIGRAPSGTALVWLLLPLLALARRRRAAGLIPRR